MLRDCQLETRALRAIVRGPILAFERAEVLADHEPYEDHRAPQLSRLQGGGPFRDPSDVRIADATTEWERHY